MFPKSTIDEALRLLATAEYSQREIARRLGISRGTVNDLANGRRGPHGRETPSRPDPPKPARCPGCGRLAVMPCVYCRAVAYRDRTRGLGRAA